MRAVVVDAASEGGLKHVELDDPGAPSHGELRVRVAASSLNFHDTLVARPGSGTPDGHIPLADGAGVVEEVGPDVTGFKVGDHVIGRFFPGWDDGRPPVGDFSISPGIGAPGYARDFVVASAEQFTHAPEGWSHEESATLPVAGLTAWRALNDGEPLSAHDTVLVLGTGGVSIFALQMAKHVGARVIATSSSDQKLEIARSLGADETINYTVDTNWGERAWNLAGGRGVTKVVEVGGPGTLPQSIEAVAVGGHIALIGVLTGHQGTVPTGQLNMKQARIQGIVVGNGEQQRQMVRSLATSSVRPHIDRTFDLNGLGEAIPYMTSGSHVGKIAIKY